MRTTYEPLNVFLSFASDVEEEVALAEEVVKKVNKNAREPLGLSLESTTWRELSPLSPEPPQNIQDKINEKVAECHIFVLVLFRRYGSVEPGAEKSNLEREVELALRRLRERKKIMFLTYFRYIPDNEDPGEQQQKVIDFRERLSRKGVWYKEYNDPDEFGDKLAHDLYGTLMRFRFSTQKHKALSSLWALGQSDRPLYAQLALIYPPVDRKFLKAESPDRFWLERLMPHLVFEDYKTLQKIEKTLRLINFRKYRIFTIENLPTELALMNRVWLCWPRNSRSLKELERYSRRARFELRPARGNSDGSIRWRHSAKSGSYATVKSPLAKYLQFQRDTNPGGPWKGRLGRIVGKDFGVFSRFSDHNREEPTKTSVSFKDYFLGGIRGLGTWGAGWYIDRRYTEFRDYGEDEDIQILLQVTYRNDRILDVRDVSSESESYFRKENSVARIRQVIEDLGPG